MLGALFAQLGGVEWGARAVVAVYVALLPLSAAHLCRAAGRSGWWGLLLVPFTFEFNLAWGFTAYCFAAMLLLWLLAASLPEAPSRPRMLLAASLALLLGWTHPQVAAVGTGLCVYLALFASDTRDRVRHVATGLLCLTVPVVWLSSASGAASDNFAGGIQYEDLSVLLQRLATYSVDTLPGPLEQGLLLVALVLAALSWIGRPEPLDWSQRKLLIIPLTCAAMYFVAPFNMSGQAVCQRMPYLALIFMPLLLAPRWPSRGLKALLVAMALLGSMHTGTALVGFDLEARQGLQPLINAAPRGQRTLYVPYDVRSAFVNHPAYAHAGAWLTLRRGGVYATNFDRLTVRYRPQVDRKGTIMGHEYRLYSHYEKTGKPLPLSAKQVAYWNLHLVRMPSDMPMSPVETTDPSTRVVGFAPPWTLTQTR